MNIKKMAAVAVLGLSALAPGSVATASDLPPDTNSPIVCVTATFSPLPADANTATGIVVKRRDNIMTNLVPPPALRSLVAHCENVHGFTANRDAYVLGLPYPRNPGPIRRHLTIVACSKLGSLAFDQTITPSRDFSAKLQPIPAGSTLEKVYCSK